MRGTAAVLAALVLAAPRSGLAQTSIGELRIQLGAGSALRPGGVHAPADFPPPIGRALAGISASLSFIHHDLSAGPEVMLFRGSDRRMYELGGVARLNLANDSVRTSW